VQACRAALDDDGPREVLADSLGGERGELVMLQLALDRGDGTPEQRRRARKLAAAHGAEWSALEGLANRVTFRRGFVDAIEVDARVLAKRAADIFARAPLCEHVVITGLSLPAGEADPIASLRAALEVLPPLRGVFLDSIASLHATSTGQQLATRPPARMLEAMVQHLRVGSFGCASHFVELVQPPSRIWIHGNVPPALLSGEVTALRENQLARVHALPATITELELRGGMITELDAPRLERLTVDPLSLAYRLANLARFPALRSLTIDQGVRPLVEPPQLLEPFTHPALREVRAINLSEAAVFAIAKSLGAQLRLLDVRGSAAELYLHHAELQALVAGDVVTGGHVEMRPLSWLGRRPRELMWDHPLIELRRA